MRFLKEYVIFFLIIMFIVCIEIISNKITYESVYKLNDSIKKLEMSLYDNKDDEAKKKINEFSLEWKNRESKLSYYMEHNELEKISSVITNLKSDIENDNKEEVQKEIDEIKFRIEHIKNKQKMELKNIF